MAKRGGGGGNKATKCKFEIKFDPQKRKEYITGFKKRKDEQTINDVIVVYEKGLANSKFTRTYVMDKEFYNLNLILSKIKDDQDEEYFRYENAFTEYE